MSRSIISMNSFRESRNPSRRSCAFCALSLIHISEPTRLKRIAFEEDGNVVLETNADDDDITYDEVSSGLLVGEIRRRRQELFESLQIYYRVFILKEDVSEYLGEV